MPTPTERRALLFLSGLILLGAAVRASAAWSARPSPAPADQQALAHQIAAVDTARSRARARKPARKRRTTGASSAGRRPRRARRAVPGSAPAGTSTSPVERGRGVTQRVEPPPTRIAYDASGEKIDLDVATAAEIERLPRIGPALAARIVADRDSLGPFGSLDGFMRVRGVGRSLVQLVAAHVTFSLEPRPHPVDDRAGAGAGKTHRGRSRRTRSP